MIALDHSATKWAYFFGLYILLACQFYAIMWVQHVHLPGLLYNTAHRDDWSLVCVNQPCNVCFFLLLCDCDNLGMLHLLSSLDVT